MKNPTQVSRPYFSRRAGNKQGNHVFIARNGFAVYDTTQCFCLIFIVAAGPHTYLSLDINPIPLIEYCNKGQSHTYSNNFLPGLQMICE